MVLSAGFTVTQYVYADTSPAAQAAALFRLQTLNLKYSDQLPRSSWEGTFQQFFPMDVRTVTSQQVLQLVQSFPASRFLLVAGWPCEDLSAAGNGRGLAGSRSSAFFDAVRILGCLQQLLSHPPAYFLENTYMLWGHTAKHVKEVDLPRINTILGPGFTTDAARFGSGAYRLRMFWTNLQSAVHMNLALSQWRRPPGLTVDRLLDPDRLPLQLARSRCQPLPNYPCNSDPSTVEALPTLVSFPASNNFREGKPGVGCGTAT